LSDTNFIGHTACPKCTSNDKDKRGDNLGVYEDLTAYCFSCGYFIGNIEKFLKKGIGDITFVSPSLGTVQEVPLHVVHDVKEPWRGITETTLALYGVRSSDHSILFPYGPNRAKVRSLDKKAFFMTGPKEGSIPLFGMDRFQRGQGRSVTITEGEPDAMAAYQMLGSQWACVSVPGATAARGACAEARDWLNTFEKIYLCFDNDTAGQDAAAEVAKLFDVNKIYHVKLDKHKDANDYLQAQDEKAFVAAWWAAKKFRPKGVVSSHSEIRTILSRSRQEAQATYPFPTLQSMLYGIRTGEVVLFTAPEKVGKTEVLRAIEYHLLQSTKDNIGIIHLEEEEKRSVQGLIGYHLSSPVHLPDACASIEDQMVAYEELTGADDRLHVYSHFGSDDPSVILDTVRSLATVCGCRYIFLDHISMIVSGLKGVEDERRELDQISTELAKMARELNFCLFLVSHVNDDGKTRGSRYIAKVADTIIHLDRDIEAASLDERNKTRLTCRGNRFAGITGPAGVLHFDPKTYKLSELTLEKALELDINTPYQEAA
jgi:twinkle protein